MKRIVFLFCLLCLSLSLLLAPRSLSGVGTPLTYAQTPTKQEFFKAEVLTIEKEGVKNVGGTKNSFQLVKVRLLEGEPGKILSFEHGGTMLITEKQKLEKGNTIIMTRFPEGNNQYQFVDTYRLPPLLWIIALFFIVVVAFTGKRGVGSIAGMIISIATIMFFIVPRILAGNDPLFISILGSLFIMVTTIYLAHGFSQKTSIAVLSTFISLILTGIFAVLFVKLVSLSGFGSEDAYALQQGFKDVINFQGLLLGGIIIGTLGVLDDVTTTQAATVYALAETDKKLTIDALVKKGLTVGREHIVSLVNTLVLAYAGASIGIFIFLTLSLQRQTEPLWVILNSELIVEEVVRTLAGSLGLILAVPITTLLAAFFSRYSLKIK